MRFCMLTTFYPPHHFGGDGIFVHRLSQALVERGHQVDVVHNRGAWEVLAPKRSVDEALSEDGICRTPLRSAWRRLDLIAMHQTGRPWGLKSELRRLFERGNYDVIHLHNPSLMGAPKILDWARLTDAVTLYTAHDHWLVCPMHVLWRHQQEPCERQTCLSCQIGSGRPPQLWRYSNLSETSLEALDVIFAPSRFCLERHRAYGFPREMVQLPHFCPDLTSSFNREEPKPPIGWPFFLYAGRLEKLKGPQTLIPIFKERPAIHLAIAGSGSLDNELRRMAAGATNIHFLGSIGQSALASYYRNAQAVIVPSLCHEVFGLVAVESLSAGTPAIVREVGALPELIDHGQTGYIYRSQTELLQAIKNLCNQSARQAMGQRARAAYETHWTLNQHLESYLAVIKERMKCRQP